MAIFDLQMPGLDGIETAVQLWIRFAIPALVVCEDAGDNLLARTSDAHVAGLLMKPIREAELISAIAAANRFASELRTLREHSASVFQELADRKVIERAKGIIMRAQRMDEAEAFKFLQSLARRSRKKLIDVASNLLIADEALRLPVDHN